MNAAETTSKPTRDIGGWGALSIVAGSMLGIGIFLAPSQMAAHIHSPVLFVGLWIATGVVVLGGALAYADLGVRMPKAGGDYVFQREALGPSVAFATGWGLFAAIFCGSIAAVAVALGEYQLSALLGVDLRSAAFSLGHWTVSRAQLAGAGVIIVLTWLNARGVRFSSVLQTAMTLVPVAALTILGAAAITIWMSGGLPAPVEPVAQISLTIGGLTTAYLAATFAFSGWNAVIYVGGEVRSPRRNIPLALVGGTAAVTALYVLLALAFVLVLGMGGIAAAGESGTPLAATVLGPWARQGMNVLVMVCLLATLNGTILGGGRVAYAMAKDGVFLRQAGTLDRRHVPQVALWLQAMWSIALVLSNSFETLLLAVSLSMVVTGSLTVIAFLVLRRQTPSEFSPWGGVTLPLLYLLSNLVVIVVQVREVFISASASVTPLLGLAVVLAAFTGHLGWRRIRRSPA